MSKATQAGRCAYNRARREGLSVVDSLRSYSKAYSAIFRKSAKGKRYYKEYRQTWAESEVAKLKHRDSSSRMCFRKAVKIGRLISGGWPDAGRIEQKIGTGFVTPNQWLRAAWAETQKVGFKLLFAKTQEDTLYSSKCEVISFSVYAQRLGMLKEWNELTRKLKSA